MNIIRYEIKANLHFLVTLRRYKRTPTGYSRHVRHWVGLADRELDVVAIGQPVSLFVWERQSASIFLHYGFIDVIFIVFWSYCWRQWRISYALITLLVLSSVFHSNENHEGALKKGVPRLSLETLPLRSVSGQSKCRFRLPRLGYSAVIVLHYSLAFLPFSWAFVWSLKVV